MNKHDLIAAVAARTGLTKKVASKAVDAVFDAIVESLKSGQEVRLAGFGNFTVQQRGVRVGRNPRTGEQITIPAARVPKFRSSKAFKDALAPTGLHGGPTAKP